MHGGRLLGTAAYVCLTGTVLAAPWIFGAWEMWWFWLFTVSIFLAGLFQALQWLIHALGDPPHEPSGAETMGGRPSRIAVFCYLPFLLYALVRCAWAGVFMDAERNFLLFLTPFVVAVLVAFGCNVRQRRLLGHLVMLDLCMLGLYGILNHLVTGSRWVMWEVAYPQYVAEHRASGSYFCPNHYAGIMELALCLALPWIVTRGTGWKRKAAGGLLAAVAVAGVIFSRSRGGGMTVIVVALAATAWGLADRPRALRWGLRGAILSAMVLGLALFWHLEPGYVQRFKVWFRSASVSGTSFAQTRTHVAAALRATDRGHMIAGAWRAWKTAPVFGIGPGMHQNLWPHFSTSADGDREKGIWPSYMFNQYHSYEVHSDWVQLLEEHGIAGFVLFVGAAAAILILLRRGLLLPARGGPDDDSGVARHTTVMGGFFACLAMGFHSLGDFNLQMPATVWLLAVIVSLAVAAAPEGAPAAER